MVDARTDVADLAGYLARVFVGMAGEDVVSVLPTVLRRLAYGRPVETAALAAELGRPTAELDALLERFGVERDELGRVVGAGLTLRTTPHRFAVGGRRLCTWCALDALTFPPLLGTTAEVESPCPATGTTVRVRVGPAGVESVAPGGAVVSFLVSDDERVRQAFCEHVHFFASAEEAADWLASRPGSFVRPVREACEIGRLLAERVGW
jgi:alkylmercury lyase